MFCVRFVESVQDALLGPENPNKYLCICIWAVLHSVLVATVLEPKWLSPSCQGDNLISCVRLQGVVVLPVVNIVKQQRCVCTRVCTSACVCLRCSCQQLRGCVSCSPSSLLCNMKRIFWQRRFSAENVFNFWFPSSLWHWNGLYFT